MENANQVPMWDKYPLSMYKGEELEKRKLAWQRHVERRQDETSDDKQSRELEPDHKVVTCKLTNSADVKKANAVQEQGYMLSMICRDAIRAKYKELYPDVPVYAQALKERAEIKRQAEEKEQELESLTPEEYHDKYLQPERYYSVIEGNEVVFRRFFSGLGASRRVPLSQIKEYQENPYKEMIESDYLRFIKN